MSRVGKKPIPVPDGVKVTVHVDSVDVEGPKGKLKQMFPSVVRFELNDGRLHAQLVNEGDKTLGKFHGYLSVSFNICKINELVTSHVP